MSFFSTWIHYMQTTYYPSDGLKVDRPILEHQAYTFYIDKSKKQGEQEDISTAFGVSVI